MTTELQNIGVKIEHMNENLTVPCLEAYYSPANTFATISLFNVKL